VAEKKHEEENETVVEPEVVSTALIQMRSVAKSYGKTTALRGVDLLIEKGEILGLLGPNGAGKSTLLRCLTGLELPSDGTIQINGVDLADDPQTVRSQVGFLSEENPMYSDMTVYDFLAYVGRLRRLKGLDKEIVRVSEKCGFKDHLPKRVETLSKGYRQRVGLGQALMGQPEIVILDEPTNGLDPNQMVEFRHLIKELGPRTTVIVSTHNLVEAQEVCRRLVIINKGQVVADGTASELLKAESEKVRLFVDIQAEDRQAVQSVLEKLTCVKSMEAVTSSNEKACAFEIIGDPEKDVQTLLTEAIARQESKGWQLLELKVVSLDLEGIFRKLTGG
jgi:ABC-2 type transport system ATP-binding protein